MKKFILILIIILVSTLQSPPPSQAKGVADRVVISSPALANDIIVEDEGLVSLLFYMEDFEQDAIAEPTDIEQTGYELRHQFKHGDDYQTFIRTVYYPSNDGNTGYAFFVGIENGSSNFDGKWYNIRPEAEMAIQHILQNQHLTDYLIAFHTDGQHRLLDPTTLETRYVLDTGQEEWAYAFNDSHSLDGTRLYFQRTNGAQTDNVYLDLDSQEICSTGEYAAIMPTLDGQNHLFQVDNRVEMRDAETFALVEALDDVFTESNHTSIQFFPQSNHLEAFGSIWNNEARTSEIIRLNAQTLELDNVIAHPHTRRVLSGTWDSMYGLFYFNDGELLTTYEAWNETVNSPRPIAPRDEIQTLREAGVFMETIGTYHGNLYLYPRLGRYWKWDMTEADTLSGGIFVSHAHDNNADQWLQPDIHFQHVLMHGTSLYGIEVPVEGDAATLYQIDIESGEILQRITIPVSTHRLGFAALDTTDLDSIEISFGNCSAKLPFDSGSTH